MELSPTCRRRHVARRFVVAALAVALAWLALVTLVPSALGMSTSIARDPDPTTGVHRGAVVLTRERPSSLVRAGDDVVAGPRDDGPVRRVVATSPDWLLTREPDGATFPVATAMHPTTPVVVLTVPYVGLPLVALGALARWLLLAVVAALLASMLAERRHRTPVSPSSVSKTPRASLV